MLFLDQDSRNLLRVSCLFKVAFLFMGYFTPSFSV